MHFSFQVYYLFSGSPADYKIFNLYFPDVVVTRSYIWMFLSKCFLKYCQSFNETPCGKPQGVSFLSFKTKIY